MSSGMEGSYWSTTPMGQGYAGHHERRSTAPRAVDVMVAREKLGFLAGSAVAEVAPVEAEVAMEVAAAHEEYAVLPLASEQQ